jgi:hypothetical protein
MLKRLPENAGLYVRKPPQDSLHKDKLFILDHHCCEVYLDEVVEEFTYLMNGDNLRLPGNWKDLMETSRCFVANVNKLFESQTDYVVMEDTNFLPSLARLAKELQEGSGIFWNFVTFFHNEEDTKKVFRFYQDKDRALTDRAECRADFAEYPFVKQVEVPYAMLMDYQYLGGIFGRSRT